MKQNTQKLYYIFEYLWIFVWKRYSYGFIESEENICENRRYPNRPHKDGECGSSSHGSGEDSAEEQNSKNALPSNTSPNNATRRQEFLNRVSSKLKGKFIWEYPMDFTIVNYIVMYVILWWKM